ncbi:MAG TPA: glycosyltransferase [Dongiaceae bacterium]|nr:glycosyltransferase [Dongiaceae bacterium]
MERVSRSRPLAILVHTFPLPSTTFIANEVRTLEVQGVPVRLFAIRRPAADEITSGTADLAARTDYLLPMPAGAAIAAHVLTMARRPIGYLRALSRALFAGRLRPRDRRRTLLHFVEAVALAPRLAAAGCDHLHAHALSGTATIAWLLDPLGGPPFSLTAHGTDIFVERVLLAVKVDAARFTRVGTRFNRDHLVAEGASGARIEVQPFGIDTDRFRPRSPAGADGNGPLRIVTVGRLVWQKAQHLLLEACARFARAGGRFALTIVGDGTRRGELEALAGRLGIAGSVRFAGALGESEVAEALRDADLFVLSSVSEGFGMVFFEAMASGIPVVAPDLHGLSEIVDDGVEGRLFPAGSVEDLARCVGELAADRSTRQRMGAAGRLRVERGFRHAAQVGAFAARLHEARGAAAR